MRRLIQAATIVGAMVPAIAFAQSTTGTNPSGDTSPGLAPSTAAPAAAHRSNVAGHGDDGVVSGGSSSADSSSGAATGTANSGGSSSDTTASTYSDRNGPGGTSTVATSPSPLPFRNSTLIIDHSISTETIAPGSQLTPEPSLQTWISFRPRYYFNNDFSIRGRADVTVEWIENSTNSDTYLRQPEFNDFSLDLAWTGLSHVIERTHIIPSIAFGIAFPTSLASQYHGVWAVPGTLRLSVGASRKFEHLGPGDLTVGLSFIGSHAFTAATTPSFQGNGYQCDGLGDLPSVCHAASGENVAFSLWSFINAGYAYRGFSVNFSYVLINNWAYGTPDATAVPNDGMSPTVTVPRSPEDQRLRQSGWFFASVDYDFTRWLTGSVGYYCFRPILDPTGTYGDPFWAPDGASRIFLTATFNLDSLYDAFYHVATGHDRGQTASNHNNGARAHNAMVQQLMGTASF